MNAERFIEGFEFKEARRGEIVCFTLYRSSIMSVVIDAVQEPLPARPITYTLYVVHLFDAVEHVHDITGTLSTLRNKGVAMTMWG